MRAPPARSSKDLFASRAGRWTFASLVFLSLLFLVLGRIEHPAVKRLSVWVDTVSSPLLSVLSRPVDRIDALFDWAASLTSLVAENSRLKSENERLLQWQATALALERENDRLRALLNAPRLHRQRVATARVIGVTGGPFVRTVLINAGHTDGVTGDQPVVDTLGLVGRVFDVGPNAARVLLVTDLNSRIPVRLQRSGASAIARGRNDRLIELSFLPPDADVAVGDAVVTTGDGGIFQPDLLVGHVQTVEGGAILVLPVALLDRLEFVDVLAPLSRLLDSPDAQDPGEGAP